MSRLDAAVDAAVRVARDLGLEVGRPVKLRSTNNVVVWLRPTPVVAKIAPRGHNQLAWEQAAAAAAIRHDGPVVGPSELVGSTVHASDAWEMTFWPYHPQDRNRPDAAEVGSALGRLHTALEQVGAELDLPPWDRAPRDVLHRLGNDGFAEHLAEADRDLVRTALDRFSEIPATTARDRALHGSPHDYNVLKVEGEAHSIDLETVCRGPVEWDLCHLDHDAASHYLPGLSPAALRLASLVVSAMVSALCWDGVERGPDMRHHAEYHLAAVKAATV